LCRCQSQKRVLEGKHKSSSQGFFQELHIEGTNGTSPKTPIGDVAYAEALAGLPVPDLTAMERHDITWSMKTSILLVFLTAAILLAAFAEGEKGNGRSATVALASGGGDGKGNG